MPRKTESKERRCIVTRETRPVDDMLRFVLAPDGSVVPDVRRRLPGRGVWVTAEREMVDTAERKRLFARGFKAEARVDPGLADRVDKLLEDAALAALSMTRKAGAIVTGFAKVEAAIAKGAIAGIVEASDAGEDGIRKIAAALRRRFDDADQVPVYRMFRSEQLDLALGRSNVIHAALLEGHASNGFAERAGFLARYRGGAAGTDDNDGSRLTASQD